METIGTLDSLKYLFEVQKQDTPLSERRDSFHIFGDEVGGIFSRRLDSIWRYGCELPSAIHQHSDRADSRAHHQHSSPRVCRDRGKTEASAQADAGYDVSCGRDVLSDWHRFRNSSDIPWQLHRLHILAAHRTGVAGHFK